MVGKFSGYDVVVIDKFIINVLFFEYYIEGIIRMNFYGKVDILIEYICKIYNLVVGKVGCYGSVLKIWVNFILGKIVLNIYILFFKFSY